MPRRSRCRPARTLGYTGPAEWTFRRHILHYAALARSAGGVGAFLIGSELIGLTRIRTADGSFPAVAELVSLAADVRLILGASTKIGYAADWTEYGSYAPSGSTDLLFPLDPLWANANIDFVGIDFYAPLTDWRDGRDHLDATLANSIYDPAYLASRFKAGEAFDWYYATDADRIAQARTPITDGAYGKPWVYRAKDIVSWWTNRHIERIAGVERGTPTAWLAQSKPIWLPEFGIAAVDKATNAPNVFPDPKSSESAYPPFSHQNRDDLIQARAIEALYQTFDPAHPLYIAGLQSCLCRLWPADDRPGSPPHLGLGCEALSGLSAQYRHLVGWWQLGHGPLADGAARGYASRSSHRADHA